ncbi:cell cycle checkpoint protein RAD17 [Arapaima gigas]
MSKTSIETKVSLSKSSSWVEPSFGLVTGSGLNVPSVKNGIKSEDAKRRKLFNTEGTNKKLTAEHQYSLSKGLPQQDVSWVDKYSPHTQSDLAVHKKKIEEVEAWLKLHMDGGMQQMGGAILLLTGPSGCGKTATVKVLGQELGFQIQEWSNPSSVIEFKTQESCRQAFDPESRFNSFSGGSQTAVFQEFLLRANKYNCLQMLGDSHVSAKKVILIEEFPNQFYRQPACLHDILRRFVRTGRCPLVLIISDSLSGDSNSRLLFSKDVQEELSICNITFNPVAPTSMMKVLNKIVTQEASKSGGRISVPSKATLELLCTGSSGDIRNAINNLQFLQSSFWTVKKNKMKSSSSSSRVTAKAKNKSKSTKASDQDDSQAIGCKDASLFLFRALGKILYCKRNSSKDTWQPRLPAHLSEHDRDMLLVDPELVVEKSHMSPELFNLYLQQNYVDFFSDIEDVAQASKYLSDADFLTSDWNAQPTMREYSSSVATRGVIYSNSTRGRADNQATLGFKPLHKPHWLFISKKHRENCQTAKSLFVSFCLTPVSLQTELLPYLAQLSNPMRNQGQIAFIQDVGQMPLKTYPGRLKFEALTDKDPGTLDLDSNELAATDTDFGPTEPFKGAADSTKDLTSSQGTMVDLPTSQPQPSMTQALLEEEDFVIEEYDSD